MLEYVGICVYCIYIYVKLYGITMYYTYLYIQYENNQSITKDLK